MGNHDHGWRAPEEVPTDMLPVHSAIHALVRSWQGRYAKSRVRRWLVRRIQWVATVTTERVNAGLRPYGYWWYATLEVLVALAIGAPFPREVRYHWELQRNCKMTWLDSPG